MERNLRKTRVGKVTSDKMDKTITVSIEDHVKHPLYKKIVKRTYKLKAKTNEELQSELVSAKKELFNLRFQNATNQLDNTARIKEVRQNIARIQTVITQNAKAE